MKKLIDPQNPIFKDSETYQTFEARSKRIFFWRMSILILQMLVCTWLLCGFRTDLHSMERGISGPVFNLFTLSIFAWLLLMILLANWAERAEAPKNHRLWARKWIEKHTEPSEIPSDPSSTITTWSMHNLVLELQTQFTLKGWESGKRAYAALLSEGVSFLEILETSIRQNDCEVTEYIITHRLKAIRYTLNLIQLAPVAALVTTAFLMKFGEIAKAIHNPAFVLLTVYSIVSMGLMVVWVCRDRDPGQLVKPLSFGLGLIILCGGAYEGIVTFRSMAQSRLAKEATNIDAAKASAVETTAKIQQGPEPINH